MKRLSEQLRNLDAPVLGVVANFASHRGDLYYGYGYGHAPEAMRQKVADLPFS